MRRFRERRTAKVIKEFLKTVESADLDVAGLEALAKLTARRVHGVDRMAALTAAELKIAFKTAEQGRGWLRLRRCMSLLMKSTVSAGGLLAMLASDAFDEDDADE